MGTEEVKSPSLEEVEIFLKELKVKLEFQPVFFDRRGKNLDSYTMLGEWGYSSNELVQILKQLTTANYSHGPFLDTDNQPTKGHLWVFGKNIKPKNPKRKKLKTEFYIKIQLGWPNQQVICISFHPSESPLRYPFAT